MKKTTTLIVLAALIMSCNKSKPVPPEQTETDNPSTVGNDTAADDTTDCTIFTTIQGNNPTARAQYIFSHHTQFCDSALWPCVEENHNILEKTYNDAIKKYNNDHPGVKNEYYPVTWNVLEKEIISLESVEEYNCYGNYLSFQYNSDGTYEHIFITKFSTSISSYSIPLLRAIADKFKLKPYDTLVFSKGRILVDNENGTTSLKDVIVFTVKSNFYDISDDPGKGILDAVKIDPI